MRRNVRVVVAALVVLALGSGSILWGRGETGSSSGSNRKASKAKEPKLENPFGDAAEPARNPFSDDGADPFTVPARKPERIKLKVIKKDTPLDGATTRAEELKRVLLGPTLPMEKRSPISVFPADRSPRVEHGLEGKTKMNFTEHTLAELVQFLKVTHGIPACLDMRALEQMDVGSDFPITYSCDGISLRHALTFMLKNYGMAYTVRDGMLVISSAKAVADEPLIKVYDVADLVTYRDPYGRTCTDYEPLINLLTTAVDANSWSRQDGLGRIVGHDFSTAKILVVSQSYPVHRKIDALLTAIRAVADKTPGEAPMLKPAGGQPGMGGGMGGMMGGMGGMMGGGMGGPGR